MDGARGATKKRGAGISAGSPWAKRGRGAPRPDFAKHQRVRTWRHGAVRSTGRPVSRESGDSGREDVYLTPSRTLAGEGTFLGAATPSWSPSRVERTRRPSSRPSPRCATPATLREVTALHVDHGLRPGSHLDGDTCALVCASLGVSLAPGEGRGSRRATCRPRRGRARYAALRREAARVGATRIATGHTRTTRPRRCSSASSGARARAASSGIPPRRGAIVRPLIDRTRAEVLAYLRARGLPHLEDPTNATPRFLRNRVRAEVIPVLRSLAPHASRGRWRGPPTSCATTSGRWPREGRRLAAAGAVPRRRPRSREPVAVRRRVVRDLWRRAAGGAADLEARHVESVLALLGRRGPARAPLSRGFEACVRYGALAIRRRRRPTAPAGRAGPRSRGRASTRCRSGGVLEVAARRRGRPGRSGGAGGVPATASAPTGGAASKKLKAWLIDRKVPAGGAGRAPGPGGRRGVDALDPGTGRPLGEAERRRALRRVIPRDSAGGAADPGLRRCPALLYWESDVADGEDPREEVSEIAPVLQDRPALGRPHPDVRGLLPVLRPARPRAEGVRLLRLRRQGRGGRRPGRHRQGHELRRPPAGRQRLPHRRSARRHRPRSSTGSRRRA